MRQKHWHTLPLTRMHSASSECLHHTCILMHCGYLCLCPDIVCIHSSIYTWARHTFVYFLFMYMCVSPHVCALKLHGEDAFNFCPQMCCKGMLIIPRFTRTLVHPLQPYLVVSCSCKSLDARVSPFHAVTKGAPPLHVCLLCLFSCTLPRKYAV